MKPQTDSRPADDTVGDDKGSQLSRQFAKWYRMELGEEHWEIFLRAAKLAAVAPDLRTVHFLLTRIEGSDLRVVYMKDATLRLVHHMADGFGAKKSRFPTDRDLQRVDLC